MKKNGLVAKRSKSPGSNVGSDVKIVGKHSTLNGEVKSKMSTNFGQMTIHHNPKKGGWHIPDSSRERSPEFAKEFEKTGIIDHLNKHHDPSKNIRRTASGRAEELSFHHKNVQPAKAYMKDKNIDFVHVKTHGTFVGGHKKDVSGMDLPHVSGQGKWTVREKHQSATGKHTRTVRFSPYARNKKSHVHLDNPEHVEKFKKTLGLS